ncbi:MAG: hypothetical protein QOH06_5622 [Acidobacteriota bacterium]|jgi:hypothetical protein|nr:hypothetical protein [Acidobacteriota bacterium]
MVSMQIAFVTLFLGLILGSNPVELAVEGPVAAVELVLDGTVAGRIEKPPWKGQIDFGSTLVPHELVARALDADGREVARTRQWINLPRPPAEVDILLEGAGNPSKAWLTWQSRTGAQPTSIDLTLDGRPLTLGPDGKAALPAYDPESAHVLSAELQFPSNVVARRDAVFGGKYGSEVSTDLTAVPVRARRGKLTAASLQGRLLAGGKPLTVAAVEKAPAEVFVVRELGVSAALGRLGESKKKRTVQGQGMNSRLSIQDDYLRYEIGLRKEDEVRFIYPVPRSYSASGQRAELFDWSRPFTLQDGGMHWLLTRLMVPGGPPGKQRLADAVAVAGVQALSGSRPRAVVVVMGAAPEDVSLCDPATVRQYLSSVRVPLFVWSVVKTDAAASDWGKIEDVSTVSKLRAAVADLRDELESQWIVWVEGTHLPQSITLGPGAEGIELP